MNALIAEERKKYHQSLLDNEVLTRRSSDLGRISQNRL